MRFSFESNVTRVDKAAIVEKGYKLMFHILVVLLVFHPGEVLRVPAGKNETNS